MIHQIVNYVLDCLYFRGYSQSMRINVQTISKADNNNNYDDDKAMDEKHMGQGQYIISKSEVWVWDLDQKSSYKVSIRGLVRSLNQRPRSSQRSDIRKLM